MNLIFLNFSCNNLFLIILVWVIRTKVQCFNIEERLSIWKKLSDSERGSYFGFSVAQHWIKETQTNWILVGAPLAQNKQPNTNHSGALFRCPVTLEHDDCEQVKTDGKRLDEDYTSEDDETETPLLPPQADEIKNGQWLGVTLKSHRPSGTIVVCAHRYIQSNSLQYHHYGIGLCYILDHHFKVTDDLQFCKGKPMDKLHQQFGLCQSGTSLNILNDGYVIVGSPGPYTWRGTIFAKHIVGDFLERDKTIYMGPLSDTSKPVDKYSYMGMSACGGYFFSRNFTTYASGAPRSQYNGQVFFLQRVKSNESLFVNTHLTGEQFGSSFGYEVAAVDIDRDGIDELLVSAPFYYEQDKGGAVYLYKNLKENVENSYVQVLKGPVESRFGYAMTSLGDINQDGFVDVAIGAPYEAGIGAVYIFLGGKNGLNKKYSQKIMNENIKTLGYSLSGGYDMDGNGYPDLLVGAYDSDTVVLYKTRPIIDIAIHVYRSELKHINATAKGCSADPTNTESTCFSFEICFTLSQFHSFESFTVLSNVREIANRISRVYFSANTPNNGRFIVTDVSKQYCEKKTVYIKGNTVDISSPIKFVVNYTLDNTKRDSPILNKTSVKEFEATFQKDCGSDDICNSKLVLNIDTDLEKTDDAYQLDLGLNNEFILKANVENFGEAAYETNLWIIHPKDLSYIALQVEKNSTSNSICHFSNDTMVSCTLGNPFPQNTQETLQLRFEIDATKSHELLISAFVNTTSNDTSLQPSQSLSVKLQKIAKIEIKGTGTNFVFYGGEVKGESAMHFLEDMGAGVYHNYQVINHGQWRMPEFRVDILWPFQVRASPDQEQGKWLLYLKDFELVDAPEGSSCVIVGKNVKNPLNLKNSQVDSGFTNENLTVPLNMIRNSNLNRRRRDVETFVAPEVITEDDGSQRKVVTMDCEKNSAGCATIQCFIKKLPMANQVTIKLWSRLWNSTLVEDYGNSVDYVKIKSWARINIMDKHTLLDASFKVSDKVETRAYPEIIQQSRGLNIWIIIGSVVAGLVLLIILILILYKLGFFKRNRVKDTTLSGSLRKPGENESLLNEPK